MNIGQRFARFTTNVVVRRPGLWRAFRWITRKEFDVIAPRWNAMRHPDSFAPVEAALDELSIAPSRALDVGTGAGAIARILADRFPDAEIIGADLSPRMIEEARRLSEGSRIRYDIADAAALPYPDGAFDLVTLGNMIPFFDELARVVAGGGRVLIAFSAGDETPIYVPAKRLRDELGARGFSEFAEVSAGRGTALVATRR